MWNMNSGYSGYSMSNRAVDAYEDGEMPLSKWTKKMIISEVVEHEHFTEEELKKYPKNVLAEYRNETGIHADYISMMAVFYKILFNGHYMDV